MDLKRKLWGKNYAVFEVLRDETLLKRLALAFYFNNVKQTAFHRWRLDLKIGKPVRRLERSICRSTLKKWKRTFRRSKNDSLVLSFQAQKVFNVSFYTDLENTQNCRTDSEEERNQTEEDDTAPLVHHSK
jgi:hypothetical protein